MPLNENTALLDAGPRALLDYYQKKDRAVLEFTGADLRGRDFSGWLLWGCIFKGVNLAGASFSEAEMKRCVFWETDLRDTDWSYANLSKEGFTNVTDQMGTHIIHSNVENASFKGACLREASFCGSNLQRADFTGADLLNARFFQSGEHVTDISQAKFIGARLSAIEEPLSRYETSSPGALTYFELARTKGLEAAIFEDQDFVASYLQGVLAELNKARTDDKSSVAFYKHVLSSISSLRTLYSDETVPQSLIDVVNTINVELIDHIRKHPEEIHKIEPRQFEELIAELLASFGWEVGITPATKDGGYDIFAISKDVAGLTSSWVVECKKYSARNKVEVSIARELYTVKNEIKVANALLATTSSFTRGVIDFAASRYDFHLKDLEGILEWINTYRPHQGGRLYLKNNRIYIPSTSSTASKPLKVGRVDIPGHRSNEQKYAQDGDMKLDAIEDSGSRIIPDSLPQRLNYDEIVLQLIEAIRSTGVNDADVDLFYSVLRSSLSDLKDAVSRGADVNKLSGEVLGKYQKLFATPPNSTRYAQFVFGNHNKNR